MKMANRRYELTDEQWERVKDMIQHSKMGRPPKDDRQMRNAMFWLARSGARDGRIFLSGIAPGKRSTAAFVNGVMMAPCCGSFGS